MDDLLPYKGWALKGMVYSLIKDELPQWWSTTL